MDCPTYPLTHFISISLGSNHPCYCLPWSLKKLHITRNYLDLNEPNLRAKNGTNVNKEGTFSYVFSLKNVVINHHVCTYVPVRVQMVV